MTFPTFCRKSFRLLYSVRFLSDINTQKIPAASEKQSQEKVLPFEEIPEPSPLPIIGTALDYLPFSGFDASRVDKFWFKRHEKYGDIFKGKSLFGSDYFVFCRTKEDNERLFRVEGRTPYRKYVGSVTIIKNIMDYPNSMVNAKGDDWLRLRQPTNKLLLKKQNAWKYVTEQRKVCEDMVECIAKRRNYQLEVPDFADLLHAWAFEMAGTFVFSRRLGLLEKNVSAEITEAFHGFRKMMELIGTGSWDYGTLGNYTAMLGLEQSLLRTKDVIVSLINKQKEDGDLEGTILQEIIDMDSLSDIEKESLLMDILTGGIKTTSNAMALCLYCLATNMAVQEKLRKEIKSLHPEQKTSGRVIDGFPYMNAFFKEAHRLLPFPHTGILPRKFDHDVVLSGYHIPAGTTIINTINSSSNMNPEYFENPAECIPERWLDKTSSSFVTSGPFGIGARACPGRVFAKQEIFLLLIEILNRFEVRCHHEPATSIVKATGLLSRVPRFSFVSIK